MMSPCLKNLSWIPVRTTHQSYSPLIQTAIQSQRHEEDKKMFLTKCPARQTLIALMACITIFAAESFPMGEEERSHRKLMKQLWDN
jgi:hypothetical protein